MSKVKEMVKAMITEEQLKTVQEQQAKLTEGLRTLGVLDVQKQNVHGQISELSKEIEATKKELEEFLEQLTSQQFKEIEKFFDTMPKLSHTLTVKNPNTGVENEIVLEGLSSFFG